MIWIILYILISSCIAIYIFEKTSGKEYKKLKKQGIDCLDSWVCLELLGLMIVWPLWIKDIYKWIMKY